MDIALKVILTLLVASCGGLLLYKAKIPGGAIVGAMVATIIFNLSLGAAYIPNDLRVLIQLTSGMYIGAKISRQDVLGLKDLATPTFILAISLVLLNFVFATFMHLLGHLDIATALFSSSPGGMADMAIIADELGANPVYVAILQLSRLLFIYIVITPIFRFLLRNEVPTLPLSAEKPTEKMLLAAESTIDESVQAENIAAAAKLPAAISSLSFRQKVLRLGATILVGAATGLLFRYLGVKAGALLGAMLGVAAFRVCTEYTFIPLQTRIPLNLATGAYIGQQLDWNGLLMMKTLLVPVLIMWVGVLVFSLAIPPLLRRFSKLDKATAMLASSPGGLQEMSLLAEDLGAQVPKVTLLQMTRQVVVLLLFPNMLTAITHLLA